MVARPWIVIIKQLSIKPPNTLVGRNIEISAGMSADGNTASREASTSSEQLGLLNSPFSVSQKPVTTEIVGLGASSQHRPDLSPAGGGCLASSGDGRAENIPKAGDGGESQAEASLSTALIDAKMSVNASEMPPAEQGKPLALIKSTVLNADERLKETEHERAAQSHQYDMISHARIRQCPRIKHRRA